MYKRGTGVWILVAAVALWPQVLRAAGESAWRSLIAVSLTSQEQSPALPAPAPRSSSQPPESARTLPFARPDQPAAVGSEPLEPRRLWALYGITETDWQVCDDQESFSDSKQELALRLLHRLNQLGTRELASMRVTDRTLALSDAASHRGEVIIVEGIAEEVQLGELSSDQQQRYEFAAFYRVKVRMADGGVGELVCLHVPAAWLQAGHVQEPIRAAAVLLESGATRDGFWRAATLRAAWYPRETNIQLGVTGSHLLLAQGGMDVGLLDMVRKSNAQPIGRLDYEPFYSMLAVAAKIDTTRQESSAYTKLDLASVLVNPGSHQGNLFTLEATARRVTRVPVDSDTASQFGIPQHYYEIDIMIPLGDRPIRIQGPSPEKSPIFENRYPGTVCALGVPESLAQAAREAVADRSQSPLINETIRIRGFFFKIWAYPSEYVSSMAPGQLQPSPLFIATSVERVEQPPRPRDDWFAWLFAGGFILAFVVILILAWKRW